MTKLASKKETHSTVQPKCGEQDFLIRNMGGENGWTVQSPIAKRMPKPNIIPKPKRNPKAQKRTHPNRLTPGEEKEGNELKHTAIKNFLMSLFH